MEKDAEKKYLENKNREFLSERFPQFSDLISRIKSKYQTELRDAGLFIKIGTRRVLTKQSDQEYCKLRVDKFLDQPFRLSIASKNYQADSLSEVWDSSIYRANLGPEDERWTEWPGIEESTGLVIFDLSRLISLQTLILDQMLSLKSLLIVITDFDLFFAKLPLEDWQSFFIALEEHGIKIVVTFAKEESEIVNALHQFIWTNHLIFPDNIRCYFHFYGEPQRRLWNIIQREYQTMITGLGFFDDEMEMFTNSYTNLVERGGKVISPSNESIGGRAIVVGSGPSLDQFISKHKDIFGQSFVIAAGSAVEPLLHAGIKVDVCVNLERNIEMVPIFEEIADRVDLSAVKLIASSTTSPGLAKLFKDASFFFRPGLNVLSGFGATHKDTLYGCDPTVSNTALSLCAHLKFAQCILVGVDMGSIDAESHHSKFCTYSTGTTQFKNPLSLAAVAQFGGPAATNFVLQWARKSLERLIERIASRLQIINCSDGVEIKGAIPLSSEFVSSIDQYFPVKKINLTEHEWTDDYSLNKLNYIESELDALIQSLLVELESFDWENRFVLGERLGDLLWASGNKKPFPMIIRGSLYLMIWHAFSVISRVKEGQRDEFVKIFKSGLMSTLSLMENKIRIELLDKLHR